ncbi:dTDP-glucose 4,6-dehydratase [Methylopila capsulata]|uniref:dTDP-glucose 4,6-dehydratase n=1 Tax=Methylopila capsulata TaxID=61654 RepID=A0A9W6IS12_9HYPH|nr:dTDP-glucose 4,6-dehydratase [Methylopila capsulata]MBM7850993.1 dTDP-glucose 4,6-dehydratase [Methylopila capsulata]GLK54051.1 dTDP-glucose 4,6-dehydratase [Methylopila capsulata]
MRLIVTGGAGFIGSAVVRLAVREGHDVLNIDALSYASSLANVAEVSGSVRHRFAHADIRDADAMRALFRDYRPDGVIHLAAETHVDRSIDAPRVFVETNVVGTLNLLEAARAFWLDAGSPARFRFLHVSTDEVFGALAADGKFTETSPYAPNSPYAASKAASDHLARAWHATYGLPVVLTNCSNNYGPFQFPEKLIPLTILAALGGRPLPVYGDGRNVRDWLYVEDHAAALLLALSSGVVGRSYNIGGDAEATNIDIVRALCGILDEKRPKATPYDRQIAFVADRPGHDFRYAIDSTRIRDELGWAPRTTLQVGLATTVQWFLDNESWWRGRIDERAARLGLGVTPP